MLAINQKLIWDYDLKKTSLKQPEVLKWYLERQLMFGELTGLSAKTLKQLLPDLTIQPSLKELLHNYLSNE